MAHANTYLPSGGSYCILRDVVSVRKQFDEQQSVQVSGHQVVWMMLHEAVSDRFHGQGLRVWMTLNLEGLVGNQSLDEPRKPMAKMILLMS